MTAHPSLTSFRSRVSRGALALGGAIAALIATGDRTVYSVPSSSQGIDPLDVLTTKSRPNIYLVIDSSNSMAQRTDFIGLSGFRLNGSEDEPNSRMALAKTVLRDLVQANQNVANFAFARYKGDSAPSLDAGAEPRFVYSTDTIDFPTITITSALFDLRQFSMSAAATIPFTEGAAARTSASLPVANYNTGWDLAAAVQTALNGAAGKTNTYKVTFTDPPGGTDARFMISTTNASPVPFTIKGGTMAATLRTTLGFAAADALTAPILTPPSNGSTSYNLGTTDAFTFSENGVSRSASLLSSNYTSSALLATGLQTAMNAVATKTNTYVVTFTSNRYVITATNAGAVPFVVNGGTFTSSSRTALGFANANASSTTGSGSITTPAEPSGGTVAMTANRGSTTSFVNLDGTGSVIGFNNSGRGRNGATGVVTNWIAVNKFFTDMTLRIGPDGTPCGIIPATTPRTTAAAITVQPMTSCDPTASPTVTGTAFTFTMAGATWGGGAGCTGIDQLQSMAACTTIGTVQFDSVAPYLQPTVTIKDLDAGSGVNIGIEGYSETGFLGAISAGVDLTMPLQKGIRQNAATPIAESLIGIFKEFNTLWINSIASQAVSKRQKNFVIFVTDGDDTCATTTSAAAVPDFNTATKLKNNALRAAYVAEELYKGVDRVATTATRATGSTWPPATGTRDPESSVTSFMVVFGASAALTNANYVAWGGSGMTQAVDGSTSSFGTRWATGPADKTGCSTCRDAFQATTADELTTAIQTAINLTLTGEFSDQQSVTETVYEYVKLAPTPAPTVPATPTPAAQDPMNALSRYSRTVPVLLQSTFEMPGFKGHLTAFRNDGSGGGIELWDAGQKLQNRVVNGVTGTDGMGAGEYNFAELMGTNGGLTPITMRESDARIKRRIFTTRMNGRLTTSEYTPQNLVDQAPILNGPSAGFERLALWPPSEAVSSSDPANPPGILDTVLGFGAAADVAAVQAVVSDACKGATAGDCYTGTAAVKLAKAKREAREILLAWLAGATPVRAGADPKRVSNEIVYTARSWVLAESTLASPAVLAPPPQAETTEFKRDEYLLYRDGPRKGAGSGTDPCAPTAALQSATCFAVNGFKSGLGLRNPDLDGSSADGTLTAQANTALKPVMSTVYHSTNAGLHAFRAGPCPTTSTYSPIGTAQSLSCATGTVETGGEELWAFVPYDQLDKVKSLLLPQLNDANKVYMLAAPVRFSDVWIDGGWAKDVGLYPTPIKAVTGTGVWRTLAFLGRGAGGKFLTAMDATVSGVVGSHSLDTYLPVVVWNRGNPDSYDSANYAKFGETWSVPAVSRVVSADYSLNDHVLFMGGGYSSNDAEGSTFFVMSPRTGDIIRAFTISDGTSTAPNPPFRNKLVAGPSVVSELDDGRSSLDLTFLGNPAGALTKSVFFPDLHGRIWKYSTASPASSPIIFANPRADDGVDHPMANSVAFLRFYPTPTPSPASSPAPTPTLHVFVESGNDNRVPLRATSAGVSTGTPFRMFGYRDEGAYPATAYLTRDFGPTFRGQTQPATAFVAGETPVVFFAGNESAAETNGCYSQFNAVLFALRASTGVAAFDLQANSASDDSSIIVTGQRINAIRVSGTVLVVDTGLAANIPPPPPEAPTTGQTTAVGSSVATVSVGGDPTNAEHQKFRTTNVPYRVGTSSCRANQ